MAGFGGYGRYRSTALLTGCVLAGAAVALVSPSHASAAELSCTARPGVDTVVVDGTAACGSTVDEFSRALAHALDAVSFARADAGGSALSVARSGGVAAAETTAGTVGAVSIGGDSVSIVSPDPGALAFALSLTRGQTFVGTVAEGVSCQAGAGFAVNLSTGQICVSDGSTTWTSMP
ncbi:hypothetical protein CH289_07095 [Rhodococcus sp. RS1C4]|uniref:DUF6764 family protein n=1 Tax=Nocardiaceae TaxID=85025 RepID=UPI00037B1C21|nr:MULTISPECIES: DUF6764 family protein [Rhodococcus]OZC52237.1 hypothetical protein CH267_19845 [Rhodococcus sp. 06-621-2]OZC54956.1 hypothetical protein CH289_07095 [Rhodococcus sp. RS1C4]OZC74464.1 hypothetical protein CH282_28220 [Rhodococcus sp. 06-418-1B]OZD09962.1 hypothetical protein CH280_22435 [Rhodococcus sp. 06-156-4C]OZD21867.1 hypothetical protein CH253_13075 [Rhodococcus sp. 06-156-3C]